MRLQVIRLLNSTPTGRPFLLSPNPLSRLLIAPLPHINSFQTRGIKALPPRFLHLGGNYSGLSSLYREERVMSMSIPR